MSYIEKLLAGTGVEWKVLGEISIQINGMSGVTNKWAEKGNCRFIDYLNAYKHIKIDINQLPFATVKKLNQTELKRGDILFTSASETPDECAISSVIEGEIESGVFLDDHLFGIRINESYKDIIDPTFLNYYFHGPDFRKIVNKAVRGVTRFYISKVDFMKLLVPIPTLVVQRKIVDILDNFTTLEAELEAELDCRKRQYEYYRNQLLSLDVIKRQQGINNVTWLTLEEVFETRNGYTPSKANAAFWENGTIPWFRMEDIRANGGVLKDSIQHVTPQAIKGKGLFMAGSIIMATTATIGEHALITVDALANQRFTNFRVRNSMEDKLLTKFVYYYFFVIDEWCKQNVNVSSFPSVEIERLKKQPFPIPPLAEQQRIVSILDKFEALTTSISEGLPKEIELRRKQYEYYRNQLLSFA